MKLKEIIVTLLFGALIFGILLIGANRIDRIENGDMVLVSQSQMDR